MENNEYISIKLKKEWDNPQRPDCKLNSGVYAVKSENTKCLENILINKDSACILIAGDRGAGKTSFVNYCVREAGEKLKSSEEEVKFPILKQLFSVPFTNLVLININAAHLKSYIGLEQKRSELDKILEFLIYKFQEAHAEPLLFTEMIKYYLKLFWMRFTRRPKRYYPTKLNNLIVKTRASEYLTEVEFSRRIYFDILGIISLFICVISIVILKYDHSGHIVSSMSNYISYKLIPWTTGAAALASFSYSMWRKTIYRFSKKYLDLEKEFTDLFEIKDPRTKYIFIFDEFDAIRKEDGEQKYSEAKEIIKKCKNIFHYVEALFIFIGDSQLEYEINLKSEENVYSTLFTHCIYINLPDKEELLDYLDKILFECPDVDQEERWDLVKHYLIMKSDASMRMICQNIYNYYDSEQEIFSISKNEMDSTEIKKVKTFRLAYEYYDSLIIKRIGEQKRNHTIYKKVAELFGDEYWQGGQVLSDNILTKQPTKNLVEILRNLLIIEDNKIDITLRPEDIPPTIEIPVPHERELLEKFKQYKEKVACLVKKFNKNEEWVYSVLSIDNESIRKEIEEKLEEYFIKSDQEYDRRKRGKGILLMPYTSNQVKKIEQYLEKIETEKVKVWIAYLRQEWDFTNSILEENSDEDIKKIFSRLGDTIYNQIKEHSYPICYNPQEKNKFILVVEDMELGREIFNKIKESKLDLFINIIDQDTIAENLDAWISQRQIYQFNNNFIIKSGVVIKGKTLELFEIHTKKDNSNNIGTFLNLERETLAKGIIRAEVELSEAAIFNFILGYNDIHGQEKYYICRLDSRELIENQGDGILFKNAGAGWAYYDPIKRFNSKIMSKIRIRIVFSDQLIKFEKFTGRRYELIEIVENVFDSGSIGFFNESGYAIVSKFSYSKK